MGPTAPDDLAVLVVADETLDTFGDVGQAAAAVVERHRRIGDQRVAVHAGRGPQVLRWARHLREIANPGQVVVSAVVAPLLREALPAGHELRDLGIHRLRGLGPPERVFELRPVDEASESRPLRSLDTYPHNLPIQLTSFVGRDAELAAVRSLLGRDQVVTVAGAGGCGKTRLALYAAAADAERWDDGVWWVDLQSVADPSAVPIRVADVVGALVEPVGGPLRSLANQLRDRRLLLCLDNCEHVLDAVADLVETLLTSCPEVTVLATSREPLHVPGEAVWRLPTLRDQEAVELFVERAQQVHPPFAVDDTAADDDGAGAGAAVQRICWGLDGIPLAIELAAAWVRSLTLPQIEAGLDDRLSLLVRGSRGAAARHQTLEASIDWSHDLLEPAQRTLLRRLSVFPAGFSLDAAQAVCADDNLQPAAVLVLLDSLADRSLVVVEDQDEDGDGGRRFRLLETIRQYAARRLDEAGELAAVRDRHLGHVLAFAEHVEPLLDHDKDTWCALVEPQREDIRTALDWGLSADDAERGRRLAVATAWLWNLRGHGREGLAILRRAMDREPQARSLLQARLMLGYALVGDTAAPTDLDPVREGRALAAELGDGRLHGRFLTLAAVGSFYVDNGLDPAWELCDDAVRLADAAGDDPGRDMALALQGLILHLRDRHREALDLLAPVTDRLVGRGERGIASTILVFQSSSALLTAQVELAHRLAERAAEVAQPLGDYHRVGTVRSHLALLQGVAGDVDGALELLHGFVRLVEGAGTGVVVPGMARTLGLLHLWRGDADEAARWLEPSVPADDDDASRISADGLAMPGLAEALRRQGRDADAAAVLDRAEAMARRMGPARVLADVLDQRAQFGATDDPAAAFELHQEALQLRVDHGLRVSQIVSLELLAPILARTRRAANATRVLAAAAATRSAIGVPRPPVDEPPYQATVAELCAALGDDEYEAAWQDGSRLTLDEAVVLVRRTRGRRRRPTAGWSSLTPTEMQVVELVVDGLSNPEIAAKLFMQRSTVKSHLSHVFAKLEISNRTELAAIAAPRLGEATP